MRRFEHQADAKFWEAWIKDDVVFCYRYGKLGSAGHTKLKKFPARDQAEAELSAKIEEKLAEGFVETGAPPPSLATASSEGARKGTPEVSGDRPRRAAPEARPGAARTPLPVRASAPTRRPETSPERVREALMDVALTARARSWKRARAVRRARRALERFPDKDTARHPELDAKLMDALASKSLSSEQALALLWELDSAAFARALARWSSGTAAPTGVESWQHLAERLADPELALRLARIELMRNRVPAAAWNRELTVLLPHLEHALARAGSTTGALASELAARGQDALARALTPGNTP